MNNSQVGAYFNYYYFFVIQKKILGAKKNSFTKCSWDSQYKNSE